MEFADRMRELRERAGLTKTALAAPRYTVSFVSQIESGRRRPSPEALEFFAGRLGVSPQFLATGTPDDLEDRLRFQLEDARRVLTHGDLRSADRLLTGVFAEAEEYTLPTLRAESLVLRGELLRIDGRMRQAIDAYEEALEATLPQRAAGMAVSGLARAYRTLGDLSYAIDLVERFLGEARDVPLDVTISAELHSVLVSLYFERGDVTRAERAVERALAAAEDGAAPEVRANAYWDAARVVAEQRHWDEALDLARRARAIMEDLDDRRSVARLHNVYAYLLLETVPPKTEEARKHLDVAERRLKQVGTESDLAYLFAERARLSLIRDDPEETLRFAERALYHVGEDELERATILFLRGRALARLDRGHESEEAFRDAAAIFRKLGSRQQEASCWRELGELQLAQGDSDAALAALRSGLDALDPGRSRA